MKKTITIILALFILLSIVPTAFSCGARPDDNGKLNIVCTIFPEYDWVKQILGTHTDEIELTLLLNNGVDFHSYQPGFDDFILISNCDIFVFVGGESEKWVDDTLKNASNKNMSVINLLDVLGDAAKEEQVIDGMQTEEDEPHDDGDTDIEYDEHIWLSLKNAKIICAEINEVIKKADPANAADYDANCAEYISRLNALDSEYSSAIEDAKFKTLLFGDRFPFRYLTDDYGLSSYAAFLGCSAETEASVETIIFLSEKIDELGLGSVLTIDGSEKKIANQIINNTKGKNQVVLTLDSMQSKTLNDSNNGVTYLSVMTSNLDVLKQALN